MLKMRIRTNNKCITWDISKFIGNLFVLVFSLLFVYGGIQYLHVLSTNITIK